MLKNSFRTLHLSITGIDWHFVRSSAFLSGGVVIARVLGLAFSLVLARVLLSSDYGYVQYALTVAHVMGLLTQPFVQHVVARFVGKHHQNADDVEHLVNNALWIFAALFVVTVLVSFALVRADAVNLSILVVYAGSSLFFAYYGLARGLLDNTRLLAAYLGSNAVQIIATVVIFVVLGNRSAEVALLVYGLSYLVPLALLQLYTPLPVKFRLQRPERNWIESLVRFATPIWFSHAGYIVYLSVDILLLERFTDNATVGQYSLTRTIALVFSFVPWGINTILMPKVAGLPSMQQQRRLLLTSTVFYLAASGVMFIPYAVLYPRFVGLVFDATYVVGPEIYIVAAIGHIVFGLHSIVSSVMVGNDRAKFETLSVAVGAALSVLTGILIIPIWGGAGAALVVLIGAIGALMVYAIVYGLRLVRRRLTIAPPAVVPQ